MARHIVFVLIILNFAWLSTKAQEPDIVVAQPGQSITVWKGFNVSGTIFLKIDGGPGQDCAKFWWNRFGFNSDIGVFCDNAEIGFRFPLIYAQLRAGEFSRPVAIAISDDASVAYSVELCGRFVNC
jgi:hypothetical protein